MPRRPNRPEKKTIHVIVNNSPIAVVLHPPAGSKTSWYAYWSGAGYGRSTGHESFDEASVAAENMVRTWKNGGTGHCAQADDLVLTDEQFEAIQRAHYDSRTEKIDRLRNEKTLSSYLEAIRAFKAISGVGSIASATADDCSRFQREALKMPKNWRQQYPRGVKPEEAERLSPNTVLKWTRALRAAFERANRNAGRGCIRGIVPESKLLSSNPWVQFKWIEEREKPIRQFDAREIHSLLDYFENDWPGVTIAPLLVKAFLWSGGRLIEVTSLEWSKMHEIDGEVHFDFVGKSRVKRWFRIPKAVHEQLAAVRMKSPFVFASYNDQIRRFHDRNGRPDIARRVGEVFSPQCLGNWLADRMEDWSSPLANGHAYVHLLRKSAMQFALDGENINREVAGDLRVGEAVMNKSYVKETDEALRQKSNRTFYRIPLNWPRDLQERLGHVEESSAALKQQLRKATEAENWGLANTLIATLAMSNGPP
jgi:hypothetical protein